MADNKPKIKDENYYTIHGWMINRLGLKGIQLSLYAIIYGFTQDGENEYKGRTQYLCDFTGGTSKPTVLKALQELVDKGYLQKRDEVINGVRFVRYRAVRPHDEEAGKEFLPPVKKFNGDGKEILPPPGKEILPPTLHNNNTDIPIETNSESPSYEDEFDHLWKLYPRKEGRKNALLAYKRARKKGTSYEEVRSGVIKYAEICKGRETRYIKQGSTWFNGECWTDEIQSGTAVERQSSFDTDEFFCAAVRRSLGADFFDDSDDLIKHITAN